jgi:TonB-dependent starch-binding outer membrane protein SusC
MRKHALLLMRKSNTTRLLHTFFLMGLVLICQLQVTMASDDPPALQQLVTGEVTDGTTGEPLAGVSVLIKGTSKGTITDENGKFAINASPESVLVFSYLGFMNEEIKVGSSTEINVTLVADVVQLNELIMVGYGVQKKKLSTGATTNINSDELNQKHTLRLEQAIQGLAPGVQVTSNSGQPGEELKVRIRGIGTVGDADPLYVIDGVPVDDISYLSPADIESVDILKDAASTAIYGTRAANGVVLITTKKGKAGQTVVSYDGYYGVQNPVKELEMLNARDYMMIINESLANDNNSNNDPKFTQQRIDNAGEGTNWIDAMFNRNAPIQNHTFSFSGGSENSTFSSSVSYFSQEGIVGKFNTSNFERISVRINSEHKLYKDILKVGENVVFSDYKKRGVGVGNIYDNSVRPFINANPTFPIYSDLTEDGFGRSMAYPDQANPVASMYYNNFKKKHTDKVVGNIYAELEIIKGLKLRSDYGIDLGFRSENEFKPIYQLTTILYNEHSEAIMRLRRDFTSNLENYITYSKSIGNHSFTVLAGNTWEETKEFSVEGTEQDLIIEDFDHAILDNGTAENPIDVKGNKKDNALLSYFGRLNYNYAEKYLFTATFRRDGSSRFGPDNRFGNFPSFSAGWVLTEENFINMQWLDFFKFRASWGQVGNDRIGDFAYESLIESQYKDYYLGTDEEKQVGSAPPKIPNPKLKWEISEQTDIGFDSRFLGDFIFAFDYYIKTTRDWLIDAPISDIVGADEQPTINGGSVQNKGMEFNLGYYHYTSDGFSFSVNTNLAYNHNEVIKINNESGIINGEASILFNGITEIYRAEEGYPIGYFYGYKADGIFQNEDEINNYTYEGELIQPDAVPGDVKFVDINNDGTINSDDRTMIGNPHPDFTYGLSFNADYKGFDFSFSLQGVAGNQVINGSRDNTRVYT